MSDQAREARAVAEALIQQVPYQDKLVGLIKRHSFNYTYGIMDITDVCRCGHEGVHAEHLAKIIRGHLRNARIVATAPEPGTDRP